jgi:hypothetical protein
MRYIWLGSILVIHPGLFLRFSSSVSFCLPTSVSGAFLRIIPFFSSTVTQPENLETSERRPYGASLNSADVTRCEVLVNLFSDDFGWS